MGPMMKHVWPGLMFGLLVGCAADNDHPQLKVNHDSQVKVFVAWNGLLTSRGFDLLEADIPTFVKEIGQTQTVLIIPTSGADFGKAAQVRDEFKAARISNVVIGSKSDE